MPRQGEIIKLICQECRSDQLDYRGHMDDFICRKCGAQLTGFDAAAQEQAYRAANPPTLTVGAPGSGGMHCGGLTKLMEECGELIQIAAKAATYPDDDYHPDQLDPTTDAEMQTTNSRMEDEMADVLAAVQFVIRKRGLDQGAITERMATKLATFTKWDSPSEN